MKVALTTDWATPEALFDALDAEFGPFDLDPCGQREHHYSAYRIHSRGGVFYDGSCPALDGLAAPWRGRVYCNPPYGRQMPAWIEKAVAEVEAGHAERVVALIPARTDTKMWQRFVLKEAAYDRIAAHPLLTLVRFLPGRVHFGGSNAGAPFPSAVVVWEREEQDTRIVEREPDAAQLPLPT